MDLAKTILSNLLGPNGDRFSAMERITASDLMTSRELLTLLVNGQIEITADKRFRVVGNTCGSCRHFKKSGPTCGHCAVLRGRIDIPFWANQDYAAFVNSEVKQMCLCWEEVENEAISR